MNEERIEQIEQALEAVMVDGTWQRLLGCEPPNPKTTTLLAYELEKHLDGATSE